MHWFYLMLAIVFEVSGTINVKLSQGFTVLVPSLLVIVFYSCSLIFLSFAVKTIEISVAYAIWSGLGVSIISIIGLLYFQEKFDVIKVLSILFIVIGVVGLNLTASGK